MQKEERLNNANGGFLTVGVFFSFLYCILVSSALLALPFLGGGLYLAGHCALLLISLCGPIRSGMLGAHARKAGLALAFFLPALPLILIFTKPGFPDDIDFWRMAGIVLCVLIRPVVTRFAVERSKNKRFFPLGCLVQFLFLPLPLLILLFRPMPGNMAGVLTVGFVLCGILESFFGKWMNPRYAALTDAEKAEMEAVQKAHAFKMYQRVTMTAVAALQVTSVAGSAYIGVTIHDPITCMVVRLLCGFISFAAVCYRLGRPRYRDANLHILMTQGLLVWLVGMILFMCLLSNSSPIAACIFLAFCAMGAAVCAFSFTRLKADMRRVAAFVLGHMPSGAMDGMMLARMEAAALIGQIIALIGLTLINVFTASSSDGSAAFRSYSLLLTIPALLLILAAFVFCLGFPLRKLHLFKLRKYTQLREQGLENLPLRNQLEPVVVQKSVKNYGIRLVEFILRPFFYQKVKGAENVRLDEDIPCVLVCNHGEILGPVVCTLFVPFQPFRAWSAYEMMDRNMVIDRTMNGTFQDVKGFGRKILQWLMEHVGAPFLTWLLESEGCIPVYHDNPRKLMQTFRETITTMQAGDSILVFPENADTSPTHRYVQEGVSEFFTGFTMIGQMYANKTGKCPLFVPMYTDKKRRLITFGTPTRYDADAPVNEEKERLCNYLRNEILKLAGLKEAVE